MINKSLELIIMPTEKCDFNCGYCYEDFELGRMKPETILSVKRLIDNRMSEISNLDVNWFGGEPLLAYDIILEIMGHVTKTKRNGVTLNSEITTNGYALTKERFARLIELGTSQYQISFDGDREEHDKLRVKRDGKPTFDTIWGNIRKAQSTDLDFIIMIRMHVNRDNELSMERLLRRVNNEIGNDKRFVFYIRKLSRLGGKNDEALPILMEDSSSVGNLITMAHEMNYKTIDLKKNPDDQYVCYAARPNAFIIRSDGSLSKCTVGLYNDHNKIGKILSDGTLKIDNEKASLWSRGLFTGNDGELGCPAKNFPVNELGNKKLLNVIA